MKKLNLTKKGLTMLTLATVILSSSVPVYASEVATPSRQEIKAEISPMWVYDYTATIEVTYDTASAIPKTYYYEYYDSTYGWMRGTLKYVSHKTSKGKYIATFTGRMMSNPL